MNKFTLDFTGYEKIEHLRGPLERYLNNGYNPGGFLTAVLEDRLFDAVGRADATNKLFLVDIVMFVFNRMPVGSHGFVGVTSDWCEKRVTKQNETQS